MDIAMGKHTDRYVQYFMHYVKMLKFNGVQPIIVFDGGKLPSKRHTEEDRHSKREENKAKGLEYLRAGDKKKAFECFQKCVDVTPEMAYQVMKQLKKENVKYIVAPYEADAQLAYLMKSGKVTAVITEDSDMIVFECKTIIFKLDKYGEGIEIKLDRLSSVNDINLKGWSTGDIRQMCILSGCDYLPSLPGMGLKTAHRLLQKYKTADKVLQFLRFEGKTIVPADYELDFNRAEFTFLYQRVYDIDSGEMIHLNPVPANLDTTDMSFLGEKLDKETATKIALGILHPCTKLPIKDIALDSGHDNKENIPPGSRTSSSQAPFTLANQKSIATYFAKPSVQSQPRGAIISSKSESQTPLIRRDSSFMRSVMDELSISSQLSDKTSTSSVSDLSKLTTSHGAIRSSTPLKRPSCSALNSHYDSNRDENIRQRTTLNDTFGSRPVERLTLPHSVQKNRALLSSSQVRTVRTVSRFFLSSHQRPEKKEQVTAKENVPVDTLLTAKKERQAEKVLHGIQTKLTVEREVKATQPFLNEINKVAQASRKPLQSLSSNQNVSSPKKPAKSISTAAMHSRHHASQKVTNSAQPKQLNLLERYGYHATS